MSATGRVVVLVDMDCFYCQVEEKLDPKLENKPIAVVQYNAWKGGGIIAVNYPARDRGVTRHMRGDEAKAKCPEIELVRVPQVRGKADLTKYREAGKRVAEVLQKFTDLLQRASVDEAYLDITQQVKERIEKGLDDLIPDSMKSTYIVGSTTADFLDNIKTNRDMNESNVMLAVGGLIVEEIRRAVFEQTGYKCSAGIAHNKILAKLVCGLNKPNKQTILPQESVPELYSNLPIRKIKNLGGKFGESLSEKLSINYMGQLAEFSEKQLMEKFDDKIGIWLYKLARGIDLEPVTTKLIAKSIGCCKTFPGKNMLVSADNIQHWLNELSLEMSERLNQDLEENNRRGKQIIVNFTQEVDGRDVASSRTTTLNSYDASRICATTLEVLNKYCCKPDGSYKVKNLGLSVSNFDDIKKVREITSFFKTQTVEKLECKTEDKSAYDESTDELEEDESKYNFYEVQTTPDKPTESKASSSSFFKRYFQNAIKPSTSTTDELHEICSECDKQILKTEMTSHSDYHLALKLSKEADSDGKGVKRKLEQSGSLSKFLQTNESDESLETCKECNKKIKLTELESHQDYHVAKRLHAEMNSIKVQPKIENNTKKKANKPKIKSVASYFKSS